MSVDFTKPIYLICAPQRDRLAILGGSNDRAEAVAGLRFMQDGILLKCEVDEDERPGQLQEG